MRSVLVVSLLLALACGLWPCWAAAPGPKPQPRPGPLFRPPRFGPPTMPPMAPRKPTEIDRLAALRPAGWLPIPIIRANPQPWADLARRLLTAGDELSLIRGAFLAGETRLRSLAPAVQALLHHPSRRVRLHASIALCRMGVPAEPGACAALLGTPYWVRYYAAVALWQLGTPRAKRLLQRALHWQDDSFIIECISRALAEWQRPRLVPLPKLGQQKPVSLADASAIFIRESDWFWHKGRYQQCVRANSAAVLLDPENPDPYSNSAWLLWSMGLHTRAIGEYHRGLAADTSGEAAFYLAFYYQLQGDLIAAERYFKIAADLAPRNTNILRSWAHCLRRLGRLRQAMEVWQRVLEVNPTDAVAIREIKRLRQAIESEQD